MFDLYSLGYGPFFEEQTSGWDDPSVYPARVASVHRGGCEIWTERGSLLARVAGALRRGEPRDLPTVGDWVGANLGQGSDGGATIVRVCKRRTFFSRGAAGRASREQAVAANVDRVYLVMGLDGDFNPARVERYLARVWASGAEPRILLNKADVCGDPAPLIRAVELSAPAVPVAVLSALRGDGVDQVAADLRPGLTVAFVGSSGAGKSTLVNALAGEAIMPTQETRARDDRGTHTTTARTLVLLPGRGLLLDTPGMRELGLVDDAGLEEAFSDVKEVAQGCRFSDCRHAGEPGCAVQEALERGDLDAERFDHYRKLQAEAAAHERRSDARARKQNGRLWGQLHREANWARRIKEGG